MNKTFKIAEKMFDFYFKNRVVYFQYRGIRIPAQIKFPESEPNDKKYDFIYSDDTLITTTLSVDMETYYPSFDDSSTMYKGNTIGQFDISKKIGGTNITVSDKFLDSDNSDTE